MSKWEIVGIKPKRWTCDIDGQHFEGPDVKTIFNAYRWWVRDSDQRLQPGWEERVWESIAANHPRAIHKTPQKASGGVSITSAVSFIKFMTKRLTNRSLVAPAEAHRRAAICSNCPMREPILSCSICRDALKLSVSPPEAVSAPEACGACLCYLKLKVWVPRDQLGSADDFPYSGMCWMRE